MKRKLEQMNFNFLVFSILKGCFDANEQMNILLREILGRSEETFSLSLSIYIYIASKIKI